MKIIFVCTGNTCRSPMAEGILRGLVPHWEVTSRGIFVSPGTATHPNTVKLLADRLDISLDHPARQLTEEDCQWADLVLTMTPTQADFVRNLTPCSQAFSLAEFAGAGGEVPDPYGQPMAAYEATFDHLTDLIIKALRRIRRDGLDPAAGEEPAE